MKTLCWLLLVSLVLAALPAPSTPMNIARSADTQGPTHADDPAPQEEAASIGDFVWTKWNNRNNALADDGEAIWIGGAMGIVRWDKAARTYQRFSQFDGLPSSEIYAVAADNGGTLWFGGNEGLSRLGSDGRWTHFNTANSGLYSNTINGIAICASGSVWLIHGLPNGTLSRLDPDGSWRWYPSREAAVSLHFAEILETSNANKLWTVARGEVWVGYNVFDGTFWHRRAPESAWDNPAILVADLAGNVYTTVSISSSVPYVGLTVWDGTGWSTRGTWWPRIDQVTVDRDNQLWMGYTLISIVGYLPPTTEYFVGRLEGDRLVDIVQTPTTVRGLAAGPNGRWAVGDGWILEPGATTVHVFPDLPAPQTLADISTSADGRAWIVTEVVEVDRFLGYTRCESTLQVVDDHDTGRWDDDTWQSRGMGSWMRRSEPMPGGDMLYVTMFDERPITGPPRRCVLPRLQRWRDGAFLTQYDPPFVSELTTIYDIYVQDDNRIWFAYGGSGSAKVAGIHDQGTPQDHSDDIWVSYPLLPLDHHGQVAVAVDSEERLWYADPNGVYRREGDQWHAIHSEGVQDLTPTVSGAMLLHGRWNAASSGWTSNLATVIRADDSVDPWATLAGFITLQLDLAQSAMRRNIQWQVGDDGAVWYRRIDYITVLYRRDEAGLTESPRTNPAHIESFAVGANDHVWARVDGLWRLSPEPNFGFSAVPSYWLVAPGTAATARAFLESIDGFNQPVAMAISGLPPQVTADFDPNPVVAGSPLTMTITVDAGATLGSYAGSLQADAYSISHTWPFTVTVVSQVHRQWLPVLLHGR